MSVVTAELSLFRLARAVVWTLLLTTWCNLVPFWERPSKFYSCRVVHAAADFGRSRRSLFGRPNTLSAPSLFATIPQLQQIRGGSNSSSTTGSSSPSSSSASTPDRRKNQHRGGYDENFYEHHEAETQSSSPAQLLSDHDLSDEDEREEEELIPLTEEEWFNAATKERNEEWADDEEEEEEDFLAAAEENIPAEQPPTELESYEDEDAFGKLSSDADVNPDGDALSGPIEPSANIIGTGSSVEVSVTDESMASSSFATTAAVLVEDSAIDENDSAAYVDRMELADAYDEDAAALDTDGHSTDAGGVESATGSVTASPVAPDLPDSTPPARIPVLSLIDDATRAILMKELMYRRYEVDAMKPEIAAVVVAKKLHRPFEGMPTNWYKEGTKVKHNRRSVVRLLPKIVVPAILTVLAVTKGPDLVDKSKSLFLTSETTKIALLPSTTPTALSSLRESSGDGFDSGNSGEPLVPLHGAPLIEANEHTSAIDEPHPRSIKPKHNHDTIQDQLDVTWLDKGITAVERQIKAFLRWEI